MTTTKELVQELAGLCFDKECSMRYKLNGLGKFIEVKRDFDIVAYFFCDRCDPQIKLQAAIDKVKAL